MEIRNKMADQNFAEVKFTLRNGIKMPAVGLGTFRIRDPAVVYSAVDSALAVGYRLFDTAAVYQNERFLGDALRDLLPKYGLQRSDIYVTTKLSPSDQSAELVPKAFSKSLENLGLQYIDLYLIHFPGAARINSSDPKNEALRNETWNAITKLYDTGKVKAIGVSNFTVRHLRQLQKSSTIEPMVNQVEWHPHYYESDLLEYCNTHNIRLQAYCSFGGQAIRNNSLMEDPVVRDISAKHNATPAQVLLTWALQRGIAVIPKSVTPQRIKENIQLSMRMSPEELSLLDSLRNNGLKYAWDPNPIA
nr:uncharacterized oxidoreductase YtbE-like isoform X1 [Danaus plexippus plexippus]